MGAKRRSRPTLRWQRRWAWQPDDAPDFYRCLGLARLAIGCSDEVGVVAIDCRAPKPTEAWRYPRSACDVLSASVSASEAMLAVGLNIFNAPSQVAGLDRTGRILWERKLGGSIGDVACDGRYLHVHRGNADSDWITVFDSLTGNELWNVALAGIPTAGLGISRPGYAATASGRHVIELDVAARAWALDVEATDMPQGRIVHTLVDRRGATAVIANAWVRRVDRSGRLLWHTECPERLMPTRRGEQGQPKEHEPPNLGSLIHDRHLNAYLVCDLNGSMHCLDAGTGRIRWSACGLDEPTAQATGRGAVIRAATGTAVAFPCADQNLYLVDAVTGALLDRQRWPTPLETDLCTVDHGSVVVAPGAGLFGFSIR